MMVCEQQHKDGRHRRTRPLRQPQRPKKRRGGRPPPPRRRRAPALTVGPSHAAAAASHAAAALQLPPPGPGPPGRRSPLCIEGVFLPWAPGSLSGDRPPLAVGRVLLGPRERGLGGQSRRAPAAHAAGIGAHIVHQVVAAPDAHGPHFAAVGATRWTP